jgi:hypothetical protein
MWTRPGRRGVLTLVLAASLLAQSPTVAVGDPSRTPASARFLPGTTAGFFAQLTYLSVPIQNINGLYTNLHVMDMKRPGTAACPASFTRTSSSCQGVSGGNARSSQIVSTYPASSAAANEFVGFGYGVGCISGFQPGTCSPTPAVGASYPEVVYHDFVYDTGPSFAYVGYWGPTLAVNSHHTFKVEKVAAGWRTYLDGATYGTISLMDMWFGEAAYYIERAGTIPINLNQHYYFGMERRQYLGSYATYEEYWLYDGASGSGCAIFFQANNPLIGDNISSTGSAC